MEGTQIGVYRLLRQIGDGGMGSVWLAEHAMLGRRAAVKVLHPEFSSRAEIVTRFFNEARAATSIPDPGIVQIFDFGQHSDGSAYIVMELLDGEPLDRRLARQGALGLPEALRIMRQVASTLGAAHAQGIVHRDLKPENVFVVRDPEVASGERAKILDFGIAKLVGEHSGIKTQTKAVMGTPTYMSPEQCRGAGGVDQRSDVYALGCVLFTLLVGRPPFDAEGIGDIIAMHLREMPPAPSSLRPGLSTEVDQLVLRCLAKDPAQRFAHAGDLASALDRLLGSSLQSGALGSSPAYAAPSLATTLSTAAGGSRVTRPGRSGRAVALARVGIISVVGVIAMVMTYCASSASMSLEPAPGSTRGAAVAVATAPAQANSLAVPAAVIPPPAPAPKKNDPAAEVASRTRDILAQFLAWSRDHQGAPCPDIAALGESPRDPWGHAFRLTCINQPADQMIGAISAGPDGMPGTSDDIASWKLGRDVTGLVRGSRWGASVAQASRPANLQSGLSADAKRKPVPVTTNPVVTKPQDTPKPVATKLQDAPKPVATKPPDAPKPVATKPPDAPKPVNAKPSDTPTHKQDSRTGGIELDEFGIPIKRKQS